MGIKSQSLPLLTHSLHLARLYLLKVFSLPSITTRAPSVTTREPRRDFIIQPQHRGVTDVQLVLRTLR